MPAIISLALLAMALVAAKQIPPAIALGVATLVGLHLRRRTAAADTAIRTMGASDRHWDAPSRAQMALLKRGFADAMRSCVLQTMLPDLRAPVAA